MTRHRDRAAVQHVDHRSIAKQQGVDPEKLGVVVQNTGYRRSHHWHCGRQHCIKSVQAHLHTGDPVGSGRQQVNVIKRCHGATAQNTQRHARVVVGLVFGYQFSVPGKAFGCGQSAGGVDAGKFIDFKQVNFFNVCPCLVQNLQAAFKSSGNCAVQAVLHLGFGNGKAAVFQRLAIAFDNTRSQHFMHSDRILHRTRNGAHRVQAGRQGQSASCWHQPCCTFKPDNAAKGGRNANGAARVRPQTHQRRASCNRHRGARRRAARNAFNTYIRRINRCAVVRVDAHR